MFFMEQCKIRFFVIPCISLILNLVEPFELNDGEQTSFDTLNYQIFNFEKYTMLMNYNGEGYLYYHIYKEGEYDHPLIILVLIIVIFILLMILI